MATVGTRLATPALLGNGKREIGSVVSAYNKSERTQPTNDSNFMKNTPTIFPAGLPITNNAPFLNLRCLRWDRPDTLVTPTTQPVGGIYLPIPNDLKDTLTLNYQPTEMGAVVGTAVNALKNSPGQSYSSVADLSRVAGQVAGAGAVVLNNKLNSVGSNLGLGDDVGGKILSSGGLAVNPFMAVLFKNPLFKEFAFTWDFIPENKKDTDNLNFIFNKLRYHALPNLIGGNFLFGYPDMIWPQLFPVGYQFDFKHCVIKSVTLDYIPGSTPVYQAQTLASAFYKLTLHLLEVELWTREDISTIANLAGPGATVS